MEVPYRQPWRAHTVAVDGPYGSCGGTVQSDMEKDIKNIRARFVPKKFYPKKVLKLRKR